MYVDWMDVYVTLSESIRNFVIEGTRGGKAEHYSINDICIDNFTVSTGPCAGLKKNKRNTTEYIKRIVIFIHIAFLALSPESS